MTSIIVPEPRVLSNDGFKPFKLQVLKEVEVVTDRGTNDEGKPLKDFFRGKCEEDKIRILMADEASAVNKQIIDKYGPVVAAKNPKASETELREALAKEVGHLALLHKEGTNLIAVPGEAAVWTNNPVARTNAGLKVE